MTIFWLIIVILAALVAIAVLAAFFQPAWLARTLFAIPCFVLYRLRVYGRERIPASGPLLYVSNHVSFLDPIFIFLAQRRPIHFIVWAPYTRVWGLGALLRLARVIPVDGSSGPRELVESLRKAGELLSQGRTVCIFAEGGISRTGFLLPFQRGVEQILKRSPVPVVPICLDHVWGSVFSFRGGRFFGQLPRQLRRPINIAFGEALAPTSSAFTIRQAIQRLSADVAVARASERLPVHREFVRRAAAHPFRSCMVDALNHKT